MTGPPAEETQLVVIAGRGLTHFKKLKSRTVYNQLTTSGSGGSQQGYLIVYELDSNLHMFNSSTIANPYCILSVTSSLFLTLGIN